MCVYMDLFYIYIYHIKNKTRHHISHRKSRERSTCVHVRVLNVGVRVRACGCVYVCMLRVYEVNGDDKNVTWRASAFTI